MEQARLKKVTWEIMKQRVEEVHPTLAETINQLNPGKDLYFYSITYPYGSMIVENGIFRVPLENGDIVPISDSRVKSQIKEDLGYAESGIPPGIVIKNGYEIFIRTKNRILPILTTQPGSMIALWKELEKFPTFHPVRIFNIAAGARSIFMLPNISDLSLHKNLKRDFNISSPAPKNLTTQWEVFKAIASHPEVKCNWNTDLLFFPKKWLDRIKYDKAWNSLLLIFLQEAWNSCGYERNSIFYDFSISCAQAYRNLKPNPYLIDTLAHILMIGMGQEQVLEYR